MHKPSNTDSCPYINKESAIKNLGGMEWLYYKHVTNFISAYADSADTLRRLVLSGDLAEARRLVHSVKGLAATLGFSQLHCAASQLEKAILESSSSLERRLTFYTMRLHESISMMKKE